LGSKSIEKRHIKRSKAEPDYQQYLKYVEEHVLYEQAVESHNALLKKIKDEEWRRYKKGLASQARKEEWWRDIDGAGFEIEVAKLLMEKGYWVEHTGSAWGDEGVDLVLRTDGKRIIVQCKAHKAYLSAGVVRELYGTLMHEKADEAWLVATSGFYAGALSFAEGKSIKLLTIRELIRLPSLRSSSSMSLAKQTALDRSTTPDAAFSRGDYALWITEANKGDPKAQALLGTMYAHGQGVPQDYWQAESWFRKAADQGIALAQYCLGVIYNNGHGVPQNYIEAASWYRKAANQGYADAQYSLGVMYDRGEGVPQDYIEAYKWLNIAVAYVTDKEMQANASKRRDDVAKKMTPAQIAEAQKRTEELKPN
jgi:TPR repeat protein